MDAKLKYYNNEKFNQLNLHHLSCNFERLIKSNLIYKNSDKKWQESLLSSRKCYYFSRVRKKLNILPQVLESYLYNLFSNYTHSFELALGYDAFRENNEMYSGLYQAMLALEVMILYASIILKNYISRRNLKEFISKEDCEYLNSLITYDKIEELLYEWKNKYDYNRVISELLGVN